MTDETVEIHNGIDAKLIFNVTDQDGAIKDLSGATGGLRVGSKKTGLSSFVKALTVINGPAGKVQVELTDTETASIAVGSYWYQIFVTDSLSADAVVKEGYFIVKRLLASTV